MKKLIKISLLAALLTLTACSSQKIIIKNDANVGIKEHTKMQHFFLSGIAQTQEVDAVSVCGSIDKVVAVESKLTGMDIAIANIQNLLGLPSIYTPRTAKVYCNQ